MRNKFPGHKKGPIPLGIGPIGGGNSAKSPLRGGTYRPLRMSCLSDKANLTLLDFCFSSLNLFFN